MHAIYIDIQHIKYHMKMQTAKFKVSKTTVTLLKYPPLPCLMNENWIFILTDKFRYICTENVSSSVKILYVNLHQSSNW